MTSRGTSATRKSTRLAPYSVSLDDTLLQVMERINDNGEGIALVLGEGGGLISTITDGDLRRAVLAGWDLHHPVRAWFTASSKSAPITAPAGSSERTLLRLMRKHDLRHIPLLDEAGKVMDLACLSDLIRSRESDDLELSAVVMAGGEGKRLRPLTEHTPKPMLPVGKKPVVERIIGQLRDAGIRRVHLATRYKAGAFTEHFRDGAGFGVAINYVTEEEPLGTAGVLGTMRGSKEALLVVNGDILTRLNYRAFVRFHRENGADMTVGLRRYDINIPYGVIETDGIAIRGVQEKPTQKLFVNAGIYLLEPAAIAHVPEGKHYDMTDLIGELIARGRRVVGFPISEYWLDIGRHADYEQAQDDLRNGKLGLAADKVTH